MTSVLIGVSTSTGIRMCERVSCPVLNGLRYLPLLLVRVEGD